MIIKFNMEIDSIDENDMISNAKHYDMVRKLKYTFGTTNQRLDYLEISRFCLDILKVKASSFSFYLHIDE